MRNDQALRTLIIRSERPEVLDAVDHEEDTGRFERSRVAGQSDLTVKELRASPYLLASLAHAFRDSEQVRNARLWRTGFFVQLLAGLLPCLFVILQMSLRSSVQTVLIEKDKHGSVVMLGPAKATQQNDPLVVMATLRDWIVAARSVIRDRPAQNQNIRKMWNVVPKGALAHRKVLEFFTEARLFGNPRRSIDVTETHVKPFPESERMWKIEWTELTYEDGSGVPSEARFSANVAIAFAKSEIEEQLQLNPGGVFITDIAITHHQ